MSSDNQNHFEIPELIVQEIRDKIKRSYGLARKAFLTSIIALIAFAIVYVYTVSFQSESVFLSIIVSSISKVSFIAAVLLGMLSLISSTMVASYDGLLSFIKKRQMLTEKKPEKSDLWKRLHALPKEQMDELLEKIKVYTGDMN